MQIVTISSKNQITLPVDLLRQVNLAPFKKLLIDTEKETIILKPLKKSIVEEAAGSLTPYVSASKLGKKWDEILRETKRAASKRIASQI